MGVLQGGEGEGERQRVREEEREKEMESETVVLEIRHLFNISIVTLYSTTARFELKLWTLNSCEYSEYIKYILTNDYAIYI